MFLGTDAPTSMSRRKRRERCLGLLPSMSRSPSYGCLLGSVHPTQFEDIQLVTRLSRRVLHSSGSKDSNPLAVAPKRNDGPSHECTELCRSSRSTRDGYISKRSCLQVVFCR